MIKILQEKNVYDEPCQNLTPNKVKPEKVFKPYQVNSHIQKFPTFLQPKNSPYAPYQNHQPYIQQSYRPPQPNYTYNNMSYPNTYSPRPVQPVPNPTRPTFFTPRPNFSLITIPSDRTKIQPNKDLPLIITLV